MKVFYFADYEILVGGRFKVWGQSTLAYGIDDPQAFDPADLLQRMRQQAADHHGVDSDEVRIRSLNRL